jgi:hypothetical protein
MMSDLAPFVAATLRDTVVNDLRSEVEALKAEVARRSKLARRSYYGPQRGSLPYDAGSFHCRNTQFRSTGLLSTKKRTIAL